MAGYTISNDVSERAYQLEQSGGQWSNGKSCATFNPRGPSLIPADEIGDPQLLRLWSEVNGESRQDSNTKDMIFSVAYLIWHLSQYMVPEPGDVINTGTPKGVALSGHFLYLKSGDIMTRGIEKLGTQRQTLRQAIYVKVIFDVQMFSPQLRIKKSKVPWRLALFTNAQSCQTTRAQIIE